MPSVPRQIASPKNPLLPSVAVLLAAAVLFFVILGSGFGAFMKFVLATGVLAASGLLVSKWNKLEGGLGLYLLRSKWGLDHIDSLAKKHPALWQRFAEIGMIIGYGSLAYFLVGRKRLDWKNELPLYSAGIFLLVLISALIPVGSRSCFPWFPAGRSFRPPAPSSARRCPR